jgi:hypothetical protein
MPRTAYVPFTAMRNELHGLFFHVRTAGDPLVFAGAVRAAVQGLDPALSVVQLDTMAHQIDDSLWRERCSRN